jgi:opacity protein-like surface antigen
MRSIPWRRHFRALSLSALAAAVLILSPVAPASAQDGRTQTKITGLASAGYSHSFQDTDLNPGGSFNDGNGLDLQVGFQYGEYVAFTLGYHWQTESDYDTHFFPLAVRGYSPPSMSDRVRLYGEVGIGILFTRLHNEFNQPDNDNEKAAAVRLGGGVEIKLTDEVSGLVYGHYNKGMGSVDDFEYGTVGVGLQYHWNP